MRIEVASERSVILYHNETVGEKTTAQLKAIGNAVRAELGEKLLDLVPSYQSLLVIFNPLLTTHTDVSDCLIKHIEQLPPTTPRAQSELVRLPVFYDLEVGYDLERIASHHNSSIEQVIQQHCMNIYQVYAIGFAPGFAYLGEVPEQIAMPRLESPRPKVEKGSVGIADRQTAIYPATSPGGWNIIGRCPSELFNPEKDPVMPFKVGDSVQFLPITKEEFLTLGGTL
ncbi:5-oxoprolinase subunit PxpB [Reinekea marinisedimentorum]|uniref:KipI family sensor histidine kinase inhibitor n=1 Tax=Reinekea marinisedimentorum TaxID=230495 RepID=A0A4R3IA16_9GAMM|nr:5-oxoprolinase subunit PxpB [Reinekea marinisedimentorum]TCS41165.1 KipI family sensor histidine kinase inhibitor [Reinekea marinisedimentorum]